MRIKIQILLLVLITIFSCKRQNDVRKIVKKSEFNLLTDYYNFNTKMTELDTLKVYMNIGSCMHNSAEKLTITKLNDSLLITPEFKENAFSNDNFIKQKTITIHQNDTTWNLGQFIRKYKTENIKGKEPIFVIKSDTTMIKFYTNGIISRDNIVADYCIVMRKLIPNSEYHIYGKLIEEIYETPEKTE